MDENDLCLPAAIDEVSKMDLILLFALKPCREVLELAFPDMDFDYVYALMHKRRVVLAEKVAYIFLKDIPITMEVIEEIGASMGLNRYVKKMPHAFKINAVSIHIWLSNGNHHNLALPEFFVSLSSMESVIPRELINLPIDTSLIEDVTNDIEDLLPNYDLTNDFSNLRIWPDRMLPKMTLLEKLRLMFIYARSVPVSMRYNFDKVSLNVVFRLMDYVHVEFMTACEELVKKNFPELFDIKVLQKMAINDELLCGIFSQLDVHKIHTEIPKTFHVFFVLVLKRIHAYQHGPFAKIPLFYVKDGIKYCRISLRNDLFQDASIPCDIAYISLSDQNAHPAYTEFSLPAISRKIRLLYCHIMCPSFELIMDMIPEAAADKNEAIDVVDEIVMKFRAVVMRCVNLTHEKNFRARECCTDDAYRIMKQYLDPLNLVKEEHPGTNHLRTVLDRCTTAVLGALHRDDDYQVCKQLMAREISQTPGQAIYPHIFYSKT